MRLLGFLVGFLNANLHVVHFFVKKRLETLALQIVEKFMSMLFFNDTLMTHTKHFENFKSIKNNIFIIRTFTI